MGPFNQNPFYLSPEEEQRRRMPGGFGSAGMPMAAPSVATAPMAPVPSSAAASPMVSRGTPPPMASPQTGLDRAMASPYAAMAMQGLQNLAGYRTGQMPQTDPFTAYQTAVARNAELAIRRRQDARTQAQEDRAADPGYEYNKLVEQGLIDPKEISFVDFQRLGLAGVAAPSSQREWEYFSSLSEDDQKAYLDMKRSGATFGGPAGSTSYRGAGGNVEQLTTPDEMIEGERKLTRAQEMEKAQAETDAAFVDLLDTGGYDELESSLQDTRALLAEIKGGGMQATGPLEGAWSQFMGDPDTARLRAKSVLQTLQNLQITNLAPVTEKELALVQDIYANIDRDPEQNIALLEQAADMLERKLKILEKKGIYFNQNQTLRGYGTQRFAPKDTTPPGGGGGETGPVKFVRDAQGNLIRQ